MLEKRRLELEQMLDNAYATGDAKRVEAVRRTIDRENLECTAHTAERVKRIEKDVTEIKAKVCGWGVAKDIIKFVVGAALGVLGLYVKMKGVSA